MKKFYPVIHIYDFVQTLKNVELAKIAGADGVFLIDHFGYSNFNALIDQVVFDFQTPTFHIGVNYLISDNIKAFDKAKLSGYKMLWSDNSEIDIENHSNDVLRNLQDSYNINFFGGIHFKYQPKSKRTLEQALKLAFDYVRYPTLSGIATGVPADIEFIKKANLVWRNVQKLGKDPYALGLALASGVSIDNVEMYLPYIDVFLVASSIIDQKSSNEIFDSEKIKQLSEKIKSWKT